MRTEKDAILLRIASTAHAYGVTPNIVTVVGLCLGITSGILFMYNSTLPAFILLGLSIFCDALDGTLARKFHLETKTGLILDAVSDRAAETAVVLGAWAGGIIELPGLLAIIGSIMLFSLRTVSYGQKLNTDYTMFGRFERLACISIGLALPITWLSTICFVAAGGFGLISSFQIVASLMQHNLHAKKKET